MESMFEALIKWLRTQRTDVTYWLAYSGGLDSHVLLHLMAKLRVVVPLNLRAVYINHGLSPNAAAWAKHAASVCQQLQIEFQQQSINFHVTPGKSREDLARDRRYQVFAELLAPNDFLLTAHHQNDQAETLLLQLLRGAGPKGLSAMPRIKPFASGFHARPLLNFTRNELADYATQHQLKWIEDESNTDTQFTRNFLRCNVLPVLQQRWANVTNVLARAADNCAEAEQLLASVALEDLAAIQDSEPHIISIQKLQLLNPLRQRHVLRTWFSQLNFPLPSVVKLQQIQQTMLFARHDKLPHVNWGNVEVRRYRDQLHALRCLLPHDPTQVITWNLAELLTVKNFGELQAVRVNGAGLRADIDAVTVRFRQGGERVCLPGRKHHHELKKLFQEWGVLPWQRDRVPLIYVQEKLAAVVGFFIADEFVAGKNEAGWIITQRP